MIRVPHRSARRAAAVALLLAGMALAGEPPPPGDPPPAECVPPVAPPPPPEPPPPPPVLPAPPAPAPRSAAQAASAEGQTWADDSHRRLEQEITDLTGKLDRIFGEDRRLDLEQPGSYLRFRSELRADDRGKWTTRASVRASLRLPALRRWLQGMQVVLSGESKGDPTLRRLDDPGNPGFSPSLRAEQASLELRADLLRTPSTTVLQVASGVRLRWPFEYFGAVRFRQRLELFGKVTSHFTQEGVWTSRERFGERTQLDFDRTLLAHTQLRWNNAGFITGVSRGYEWATEVGVAHDLQRLRMAAYLGFAVTGFRLPKAEVELYRLFTRFRRDVWRRWLFLELEPEIGWPTTPGLGRHQVLAATLRLDVILDGRTPPSEPAKGAPAATPAPPAGEQPIPPPPGTVDPVPGDAG